MWSKRRRRQLRLEQDVAATSATLPSQGLPLNLGGPGGNSGGSGSMHMAPAQDSSSRDGDGSAGRTFGAEREEAESIKSADGCEKNPASGVNSQQLQTNLNTITAAFQKHETLSIAQLANLLNIKVDASTRQLLENLNMQLLLAAAAKQAQKVQMASHQHKQQQQQPLPQPPQPTQPIQPLLKQAQVQPPPPEPLDSRDSSSGSNIPQELQQPVHPPQQHPPEPLPQQPPQPQQQHQVSPLTSSQQRTRMPPQLESPPRGKWREGLSSRGGAPSSQPHTPVEMRRPPSPSPYSYSGLPPKLEDNVRDVPRGAPLPRRSQPPSPAQRGGPPQLSPPMSRVHPSSRRESFPPAPPPSSHVGGPPFTPEDSSPPFEPLPPAMSSHQQQQQQPQNYTTSGVKAALAQLLEAQGFRVKKPAGHSGIHPPPLPPSSHHHQGYPVGVGQVYTERCGSEDEGFDQGFEAGGFEQPFLGERGTSGPYYGGGGDFSPPPPQSVSGRGPLLGSSPCSQSRRAGLLKTPLMQRGTGKGQPQGTGGQRQGPVSPPMPLLEVDGFASGVEGSGAYREPFGGQPPSLPVYRGRGRP